MYLHSVMQVTEGRRQYCTFMNLSRQQLGSPQTLTGK